MENDARKYLEQQAEEGRACIARLENELRHAQARQQQAEQQGDVLQARITDQARAFEQEKVQLHALLQQVGRRAWRGNGWGAGQLGKGLPYDKGVTFAAVGGRVWPLHGDIRHTLRHGCW